MNATKNTTVLPSFEQIWTEVGPIEAVSALLKVREVEHTVSSCGEEVLFRDMSDILWYIRASDYFEQFRVEIGHFSEGRESPRLDVWDRLKGTGQTRAYHLTREETIDIAFGLICDVEEIVSLRLKPKYNWFKAF